MQIQDLQIFRTLYQRQSINQTAKQLRYSQSNISARLQAMEKELQQKLFIRTNRGLSPTKAGELTYQYAQTVLNATDGLTEKLAQLNQNQNVLISELLFDYLVVQKQQYDLQQYHFTIQSSTAIVTNHHPETQLVITYANFSSPVYQLVETNRLTAAFAVNQSDPAGLPFLVNSDVNCPFRQATLKNIDPTAKVTEVDSWNGIVELVKADQGYALLPTYLIKKKVCSN